jgi:hypothetical protein
VTGETPEEYASVARMAAAEERWSAALEGWEQCIQTFGARPAWLHQKAKALRKLGRLEEVRHIHQTLLQHNPPDKATLANSAMLWIGSRTASIPFRRMHLPVGAK